MLIHKCLLLIFSPNNVLLNIVQMIANLINCNNTIMISQINIYVMMIECCNS